MKKEEIKSAVRERYAGVVKQTDSCCEPGQSSGQSCCGSPSFTDTVNKLSRASSFTEKFSKAIGYSDNDLESVPEGANLGLGCGNPVALASLKEGEIVLDLGSGGGFDCFLAAQRVGKAGRVIGVDMTPEMLDGARKNAIKGGYENVEFRLGEIENLPVANAAVDVIISNCVINLSPEKDRVFLEAFRVLKPGGRLMVSDMVLLGQLPDEIRESVAAYVSCVGGASLKSEYLGAMKNAGFRDVKVVGELSLPIDSVTQDPTVQSFIKESGISKEEIARLAGLIKSIKVQAIKPVQ